MRFSSFIHCFSFQELTTVRGFSFKLSESGSEFCHEWLAECELTRPISDDVAVCTPLLEPVLHKIGGVATCCKLAVAESDHLLILSQICPFAPDGIRSRIKIKLDVV